MRIEVPHFRTLQEFIDWWHSPPATTLRRKYPTLLLKHPTVRHWIRRLEEEVADTADADKAATGQEAGERGGTAPYQVTRSGELFSPTTAEQPAVHKGALQHLPTLPSRRTTKEESAQERQKEDAKSEAHLIAERYMALKRLGLGGEAVVYLCRDTTLGRLVAVKVFRGAFFLDADEQEEFIRRIRKQAEILAALHHPHIVTIHDMGIEELEGEKRPFLVMDYLSGGSLKGRLDEFRADPKKLVELFVKVAEALGAAHKQGVVHRDVKPQNIMLDENDEPVLCDFGLARRFEFTRGAQTKTIAGTPEYMSPEQIEGRHLTPASDVWALGATMYEAFCGRLPFGHRQPMGTDFSLARRIVTEDPALPRTVNPHIHPDLDAIIMKCLEKNCLRRYQDGRELADDLRRYSSGEPVKARPISRFRLLMRRAARAKGLTVAVASLIAAAVAAVVIPLRLYISKVRRANELLHRAKVAIKEGRLQKARELLLSAHQLHESDESRAEMERVNGLLAALKRRRERAKRLTETALSEKDPNTRVRLLEAAVKADPTAEREVLLAAIYEELGQKEKALQRYRSAASKEPELIAEYALALLRRGLTEEALGVAAGGADATCRAIVQLIRGKSDTLPDLPEEGAAGEVLLRLLLLRGDENSLAEAERLIQIQKARRAWVRSLLPVVLIKKARLLAAGGKREEAVSAYLMAYALCVSAKGEAKRAREALLQATRLLVDGKRWSAAMQVARLLVGCELKRGLLDAAARREAVSLLGIAAQRCGNSELAAAAFQWLADRGDPRAAQLARLLRLAVPNFSITLPSKTIAGIAALDADADGSDEVFCVTQEPAGLWVVKPHARGADITAHTPLDEQLSFGPIGAGDVDNDGRTEILIASSGQRANKGCVAVYEFRNGRLIRENWRPSFRATCVGDGTIVVHDLDKDGKNELLLGTACYDRSLHLYRFPSCRSACYRMRSDVTGLAVSDLDGDGDEELVVSLGAWNSYELVIYPARDVAGGSAKPLAVWQKGIVHAKVATLHGQNYLIVAVVPEQSMRIKQWLPNQADPGIYIFRFSRSQGLTPVKLFFDGKEQSFVPFGNREIPYTGPGAAVCLPKMDELLVVVPAREKEEKSELWLLSLRAHKDGFSYTKALGYIYKMPCAPPTWCRCGKRSMLVVADENRLVFMGARNRPLEKMLLEVESPNNSLDVAMFLRDAGLAETALMLLQEQKDPQAALIRCLAKADVLMRRQQEEMRTTSGGALEAQWKKLLAEALRVSRTPSVRAEALRAAYEAAVECRDWRHAEFAASELAHLYSCNPLVSGKFRRLALSANLAQRLLPRLNFSSLNNTNSLLLTPFSTAGRSNTLVSSGVGWPGAVYHRLFLPQTPLRLTYVLAPRSKYSNTWGNGLLFGLISEEWAIKRTSSPPDSRAAAGVYLSISFGGETKTPLLTFSLSTYAPDKDRSWHFGKTKEELELLRTIFDRKWRISFEIHPTTGLLLGRFEIDSGNGWKPLKELRLRCEPFTLRGKYLLMVGKTPDAAEEQRTDIYPWEFGMLWDVEEVRLDAAEPVFVVEPAGDVWREMRANAAFCRGEIERAQLLWGKVVDDESLPRLWRARCALYLAVTTQDANKRRLFLKRYSSLLPRFINPAQYAFTILACAPYSVDDRILALVLWALASSDWQGSYAHFVYWSLKTAGSAGRNPAKVVSHLTSHLLHDIVSLKQRKALEHLVDRLMEVCWVAAYLRVGDAVRNAMVSVKDSGSARERIWQAASKRIIAVAKAAGRALAAGKTEQARKIVLQCLPCLVLCNACGLGKKAEELLRQYDRNGQIMWLIRKLLRR